MQFSKIQDEAMLKVKRWLDDPSSPQVFHFFGYAGTGKTTLAKHLADDVDGKVIFAAFTGKAAHVLRQKGCVNAQTIHSLIYTSRDKSKARLKELEQSLQQTVAELKSEGYEDIENHKDYIKIYKMLKEEEGFADKPFFVLNHESDISKAKLVVIDECSMVDDRMGADLLSFGVKILVLGDPAQLPPVGGEGYFTKDVIPDVMLEEIHRQAQESPILRMATDVRNMKPLTLGDWGSGCEVLPSGTKLPPDQMTEYDQIIVGKNRTRHLTNAKLRSLLGLMDPYPTIGDKIVCLRNNNELGLLNGAIFHVTSMDGVMDQKVQLSVRPEGGQASIDISAHEHYFLNREEELKWFEKGEAEQFAYGYALTCHKSQGSQWSNICVFNEAYCFKQNKFKWLYTAITRAADRITVVNM